MKSPTDAFENAEIAREEGSDRDALHRALVGVISNANSYPEKVQKHILGQNTMPLREKVVDAVIAAGFSRQSPASTTAADAHGADWSDWQVGDDGPSCSCGFNGTPEECERSRAYRVAAPEGDGGNE